MSSRILEVHPFAIREIQAARRWYQRRSPGVADRFIREIDDAVSRILATPEAFPEYLHNTRSCLLRRFPYLVIFLVDTASVKIFAVAHGKRRPAYWKRRLP